VSISFYNLNKSVS